MCCANPDENGFLSTLSEWRATERGIIYAQHGRYFYPRPLGGGRPRRRTWLSAHCPFLSTPSGWRATSALHVDRHGRHGYFYPRPPGGGRHGAVHFHGLCNSISIHALRVEGDPGGILCLRGAWIFLSTPSGWRATSRLYHRNAPIRYFYPRPPGGGRRVSDRAVGSNLIISIHALRVEGDSKNGQSFRLFLRKREKNLPL